MIFPIFIEKHIIILKMKFDNWLYKCQDVSVIGYIITSLGLFVAMIGMFGVIRFPDFFSRLHPSGLIDSFGVPMCLIGFFAYNLTQNTFDLKVIMLILIMFITSPVSCYSLSRIAKNRINIFKIRKI